MPLAVIIVSYQCAEFLAGAVESAILQTEPDDIIVVWDNNSDAATQNVLTSLSSKWPQIFVHRSSKNLGFAAGNNAASKLTPETYDLLLLNPDAFLKPNAMQAMRKALASDAAIAAVGAVQVDTNEALIDGLGDVYHFSGLPWRSHYGAKISRLEHLVPKNSPPTSEIFSACAAVALYRRGAFDSIGGFDDDYFCYCEDVDLGFRLRLAGWRCVRANQAMAVHVGSVSTGKGSDFSVYHGHRNLVWTFFKNMPTGLLILLLPAHLGMNVLAATYYSMQGRSSAIIRAKKDGFASLGKILRKRAIVQKNRVGTAWNIWKVLDKSIWRRPKDR